MYCPKCGHDIKNVEGQEYCDRCGEKLPQRYFNEPSETDESGASSKSLPESSSKANQENSSGSSSPWEDEFSVGFVRGLILTINQTLFEPGIFFKNMPRTGGQLLPVFYCLIMGVVGAILGLVSESLVESPVMTHGHFVRHMAISSIFALPLLIVLEVYFGSLVLHLSMIIFGARKENFQATLRVVAYSSGPNIFYGVPFIGWLVVAIWSFWITVVGIKVIGEISFGRALLAALAPVVLIIVLFASLLFFVIGLIGISSLG